LRENLYQNNREQNITGCFDEIANNYVQTLIQFYHPSWLYNSF
jgi:hypothetical protein